LQRLNEALYKDGSGIGHRKGNEALLCAHTCSRAFAFPLNPFAFLLHTEEAMLAVHPPGTDPDTPGPDPHASLGAVAERALRSGPYPALKKLSCDCQGGVLVLRGCLPTYYLKQIAQEVVAQQLKGAGRLDNQIQVVRVAVPETPPDLVNPDVLDPDAGVEDSPRETAPDSDRHTGMGVKVMAPSGEEVEVDG
jgi:hypothetical protein